MRKDFKERYRLIYERIKSGPCRFEQIKQHLLRSNEFQRCEITDYSIRTLQRDIKEIEIEYDVEIRNKMSYDGRYYIVN
ncbi:hypothetical protein U9K52_09625 [Chryseobacterium sp. MHB01]|uniref:hypothetical protein n=1 Tax=Chryseobacterium sp. MHB01 TaxID=3109433 RepID=UPI002AFEBED1|nr:hypothetical protein [Chryseobacterium sp. MHB01]MEA1849170.1 hypothetical protein [Chryseobacterium sp. MHB01]